MKQVGASVAPVARESIALLAVLSQIDDMVNYAVFEKFEKRHETNLTFSDYASRRIFNILLVDFLSVPQSRSGPAPFDLEAPQGTSAGDRSYLTFLSTVCSQPQLGQDVEELRDAVSRFIAWLDFEAVVPGMWLGEISVEADVRASRFELLKISGNIGKHNFSRLHADIKKIVRIYERSNAPISEDEAYRSLNSIYEWLFDNVFAYHASTIAEFLNDIRLAIHRYLKEEFVRSHHFPAGEEIVYRYRYPPGCDDELARAMYWDLMNKVRSGPIFPKFTVTQSLKGRY